MPSEGQFYSDEDLCRRSESPPYADGFAVEGADPRTPFAKDRDRIVYMSAFARLAGKSQVVATTEAGLFHNRLTHTLKVAQLGRRTAERMRRTFLLRALEESGEGFHPDIVIPPDPDLIEAACLAHDIGHPPFGHAGEEALGKTMDERFDGVKGIDELEIARSGFEGNAQTFHILTFLAGKKGMRRAQPRYGLDLTRATLDATIKYPYPRRDLTQAKWGFYKEDEEAFNWVRMGAKKGRRCFEADVMNWCDDVTYAIHDMIDCYRNGFVPLHDLFFDSRSSKKNRSRLRLSNEAVSFVKECKEHGKGFEDVDVSVIREHFHELKQYIQRLDGPYERTSQIRSATHAVASRLLDYFMNGVTWSGDAPMRYSGEFVIDQDADRAESKRVACSILQYLPWHYVIQRRGLATQQYGQGAVVEGLFGVHAHDIALDPEKRRLLPLDRAEDLAIQGNKRRAVADLVASLTEADATRLHARLAGSQSGAITDLL